MSGFHSLDGVLVDVVVGLDSSSLRSTEGFDGLDVVVSSVSVSSSGSLSEFPGMSSSGGSLSQVVESLKVGSFGSSVFVVRDNQMVVGVFGVLDGMDVVVSHMRVVLFSFNGVVDGMTEPRVSSIESVMGSTSSVEPDLVVVYGASEDSKGVSSQSLGMFVVTYNSSVMGIGMFCLVDRFFEAAVPHQECFVSPDGHLLASEVGEGLVSSLSLESHVFLHPLHSGGLSLLELSRVLKEGEVTEVVGSGTGGSSGENSDLSEHVNYFNYNSAGQF